MNVKVMSKIETEKLSYSKCMPDVNSYLQEESKILMKIRNEGQ